MEKSVDFWAVPKMDGQDSQLGTAINSNLIAPVNPWKRSNFRWADVYSDNVIFPVLKK
jgi:hypothetical protein